MVIAVDFDGTLCENLYPDIGKANIELINTLIRSQESGAELILWTCREGELLQKAIEFCASYGLRFDSVNSNLDHRICKWGGDPRKVGADYYIDDKAISPKDFCKKEGGLNE